MSHVYGEGTVSFDFGRRDTSIRRYDHVTVPRYPKPENGDWTLTFRLKSEDDSCGEALVEFLQQDEVIQSTTVTLTNSFAGYGLEIPQPDLEKIARGRCSMSELFVRVRYTARESHQG